MHKQRMQSRTVLSLISILLVFAIYPISSNALTVDTYVSDTLNSMYKVPVIVVLEGDSKFVSLSSGQRGISSQSNVVSTLSESDFDFKYSFDSVNAFSGEITQQGLEKLMQDKRVARIEYDYQVKTLLDVSGPLVNSTVLHQVQLNGANLTGKGETICVIDTGINYTHPAFGGCTSLNSGGNCRVIGGWDYHNGDADPIDDNGHGTHVSGIAVSNDSTYTGMAPEANIVALKAIGASREGSVSNVVKSIDWCVANATMFNISVITLSLGVVDGGGAEVIYTVASDCDANGTSLAVSANTAAAQGLFVVASSGNAGNTSGITSPACGTNVTSAASTSDSDAISSFSNYGPILDLLAPGSGIMSADHDGTPSSYRSDSGTSMAAPHVSGAGLLLRQYGREDLGVNLSAFLIRDVFNITGKIISGFSRINAYEAFKYLSMPTITYQSPTNTTLVTAAPDFNITVSEPLSSAFVSVDGGLNITLENDTETHYFNTSWTTLTIGQHNATYYINDTTGNTTVAVLIFTIDTIPPEISLNLPEYNASIERGSLINLSITDNSSISVVMYEYNGTNTTLASPYNINTTNIAKGFFNITVFANDSLGSGNSTLLTFTMLNSEPQVLTVQPSAHRVSGTISVNASVTDYDGQSDVTTVSFYYTNASTWVLIGSDSDNSDNTYNVSWSTSTVGDGGNYSVIASATDGTNVTNASSNLVFIINNANQAPTLSLSSPNSGTLSDTISITWSASDPDNDTLTVNIYYSTDASNWTSIILGTANDGSYSWDTTAVSNSATYIFNITVVDEASVAVSAISTSNITISNTASTTGTTSGDGGGGGAGAAATVEEVITEDVAQDDQPASSTELVDKIEAGVPKVLVLSNSKISVSSIEIITKETVENVEISVKSFKTKPASVTELSDKIYQYLEFSTSISEDAIDSVQISFSVSSNWIEDNNIDHRSVVLNRYSSSWKKLKTTFKNKTNSVYNYESTTPGFSVFAITGEEEGVFSPFICGNNICEEGEQDICPEDCSNQLPPVSQFIRENAGQMALVIIIGFVIIIALYFFRKNPPQISDLFGNKRRHYK